MASTSVLAIRGAPAAAPAGAGAGADTRLASSAAGGLFPITQRLEEEASNSPALGTAEGQEYTGDTSTVRLSSHLSAWRTENGALSMSTKPGQGAVQWLCWVVWQGV